MSWIKGLTDSLGLTSTGPSAATLEQIKTAPVGTQSLYEQRASSFDDELAQAFKPLVRGWQPGQAPLTQEQYDRIQSASLDLFDKLGYTNPMGSQPSRMVAASMRKAVRPPPKSYAEAKTPAATEVSFQHASPHKFTNVDEANPFGQFSEAHLLKGEGSTVYGPGAAYVSTAEPTHQYYMKKFAQNIKPEARFDFQKLETDFGTLPNFIKSQLSASNPSLDVNALIQFAAQPRDSYFARLPAKLAKLANDVSTDYKKSIQWLQKFKEKNATFAQYEMPPGPYSYRGSLAEDPARTLLFDKPLSEQTPEVQAALARASSRARRTLGKAGTEEKTQLNLLPAQQQAALIEHFNIRGDRSHSAWNKYMQLASSNPQVLLREANLSPLAREAVEALIAQKKPNHLQDIFANTGPPAGDYIKKYRASPKTVQRLRDAGIDLIKYSGSSASPNYVVVNPAAAKIQSRTPSIAATFGTGELARQLYESIYGKEAP